VVNETQNTIKINKWNNKLNEKQIPKQKRERANQERAPTEREPTERETMELLRKENVNVDHRECKRTSSQEITRENPRENEREPT